MIICSHCTISMIIRGLLCCLGWGFFLAFTPLYLFLSTPPSFFLSFFCLSSLDLLGISAWVHTNLLPWSIFPSFFLLSADCRLSWPEVPVIGYWIGQGCWLSAVLDLLCLWFWGWKSLRWRCWLWFEGVSVFWPSHFCCCFFWEISGWCGKIGVVQVFLLWSPLCWQVAWQTQYRWLFAG